MGEGGGAGGVVVGGGATKGARIALVLVSM